MKPSQYQAWMHRAFLNVQATLAGELSSSIGYVAEEYLRTALMKGLCHSVPAGSDRVRPEVDAWWTDHTCANPAHAPQVRPGRGRKIQHDVGIEAEPGEPDDRGLVCEIKWLKTANPSAIIGDLWKLSLAKTDDRELASRRTYLLVGGEADAFKKTLQGLRHAGVLLQWRNHKGGPPASTSIDLDALAVRAAGRDALVDLLSWGDSAHRRAAPPCRASLRASRRGLWQEWANDPVTPVTTAFRAWRLALWELDTRAAGAGAIDWNAWGAGVPFAC